MGLSEIVVLHTFSSSSQIRTGTKSSSVLPVQTCKDERKRSGCDRANGPGSGIGTARLLRRDLAAQLSIQKSQWPRSGRW